jgi:predicted nucleic acid-binding protein
VPACVVDTDVVSFLFKNSPEAQLYLGHLAGNDLVLCFMTVAELDRWTLRNNWGAGRVARLNSYLRSFIVYPFDRSLCRVWAEVSDSEQRKGRIISTADAWIAATAVLNGIPLVTHNRKDYETVDRLTLISEG